MQKTSEDLQEETFDLCTEQRSIQILDSTNSEEQSRNGGETNTNVLFRWDKVSEHSVEERLCDSCDFFMSCQ